MSQLVVQRELAVATKLQGQIVLRLQKEIKAGKVDGNLLHDVVQFGKGWAKTSQASKFMLGQVLNALRSGWESFPESFTSQYETFDYFVRDQYMLTPRTAHAWADRWLVFMSGGSQSLIVPSFVDLYSLSGSRLDLIVEFSLSGKKITKRIWSIIADESLTSKQVYSQILGRGQTLKQRQSQRHFQLIAKSGTLRVLTNGKIVELGFLSYSLKNPETRLLIESLAKKAGIEIVA